MSFNEIDIDLKLDPLNPPKFCPQCKRNGMNTRVKKYKVDPTKPNERTKGPK